MADIEDNKIVYNIEIKFGGVEETTQKIRNELNKLERTISGLKKEDIIPVKVVGANEIATVTENLRTLGEP